MPTCVVSLAGVNEGFVHQVRTELGLFKSWNNTRFLSILTDVQDEDVRLRPSSSFRQRAIENKCPGLYMPN